MHSFNPEAPYIDLCDVRAYSRGEELSFAYRARLYNGRYSDPGHYSVVICQPIKGEYHLTFGQWNLSTLTHDWMTGEPWRWNPELVLPIDAGAGWGIKDVDKVLRLAEKAILEGKI